jgi:hypothetical protein
VAALSKRRPLTIEDRAAYFEVIDRAACFYTESKEFTALIRAAHAEISGSENSPSEPRRLFDTGRLRWFFRPWRRRAERKHAD